MKLSIYIADVDKNGKWSNIVPFPYNSKEYNNGHPTLSLDGKTMYFTSDMPGSVGKTDIFKVDITETGAFTVPENLGGNVNTPGKEWYPFIAADGTLYFSSDYHKGKGKSDIFKTDSDELELAAIQNIGEPFNSSRDDFAFTLNDNLLEGYFSSNRTKGRGDDDIYYFVSNRKKELIKKQKPIQEVVCKNMIVGTVTDNGDQSLLVNSLVEILDAEGNTVYKVKVGEDAHFEYEAACSEVYKIQVSKPLYLDKEITVSTTDVLGQEVDANISLVSEVIKRDGKIIIDIESIYFDFDDHRITPQAAVELDKVIAFMYKYPKVIIEGGSHTDSRGGAAYNMKLSIRRANSTVSYIMKNGEYDGTRISAHGYGETSLVNNCSDGVKCSDEEHQLNRRTEFVIKNPSALEE
jgi:outer membrane protein OmpA-like peptidoglycan-associated protein